MLAATCTMWGVQHIHEYTVESMHRSQMCLDNGIATCYFIYE